MTKRSTKSTKSTSAKQTAPPTGGTRSRARERRRERQQEKARQRQIALLIGGAVVAVIAVVLFILINQPASAPIPEEALERYAGIPQGTTDQGFPLLGNPQAPVLLEEFSSFSCPGCAQFHDQWSDDIVEWVREGLISFAYVPLTTGSVPNALGAAKAALCAGEQGAFFEMHDALFNWHLTYGNQAFSQNRLTSGIENLGLSTSQYNDCVNSSRGDDIVERAQSLGIGSTPTVRVNGTIVETAQVANLEEIIQQAFAATGLPPAPVGEAEGDDVPVPTEVEADADVTEAADDETPSEATEEAEAAAPEDATTEADATETTDEDGEAENGEAADSEAEATEEASN